MIPQRTSLSIPTSWLTYDSFVNGCPIVCFSASAKFVGSAVLGAIGVATLTEVKHRRELLFAAMPCLFALHQFTQGFVWLGLDQRLPDTRGKLSYE